MKAKIDKVCVEATGRVGDMAYIGKCYRVEPLRLEWAYGPTVSDAFTACKLEPEVLDLEKVIEK